MKHPFGTRCRRCVQVLMLLIVWYKWRDFFSTLEYNHNLVTVYCICMARNIKLAFCYFFLFVDKYVYVYSIDALKTSRVKPQKLNH